MKKIPTVIALIVDLPFEQLNLPEIKGSYKFDDKGIANTRSDRLTD